MSEIIVAGAGCGGLVASMKLAKEGHSVTVFEKGYENKMGYEQKDAVDASYFEYADIPVPENFRAPRNRITFVPLDSGVLPVTLPDSDDGGGLIVDRKELYSYLSEQAKENGVVFRYEEEIISPVILGSRVAGIKTKSGEFFADLVIDSCGVNSPLRKNLPKHTFIQNELTRFDTLNTYRAYFEWNKEAPQPQTDYNIYLKYDGTIGFSWLVNDGECVDVLIARFPELDNSVILEELRNLNENNPHMGKNIVRGGEISAIPVRQPLAVFVCDGYAAVGDSACMTFAAKGSGIGYSLKAGTILAQTVIEDEDCLYNCETLWNYERRFFKEIGNDACKIALAKNLLPYVTAQEVSDLMKAGILTTEEMQQLCENSVSALLSPKAIPFIKDKVKLLIDFPELRNKILNVAVWFGKWALTEPQLPQKYDRAAVAKWAERYNEFFESIKYSGEIMLQ